MQQFTVTDEHIKLLRAANVGWEDCEFGAPSIDCKRPYGNGNVYGDIAEILSITPIVPDDRGAEFSNEQTDRMDALHKGTQTALQIFLATGEMKAGRYVADNYDRNWQLQK